MNQNSAGSELAQVYTKLWRTARTTFLHNAGQIDPLLQSQTPDARRGLTVIVRPGPAVATQVAAWLTEMAHDEPTQYCYTPAQLHLTVLSLFTATNDWCMTPGIVEVVRRYPLTSTQPVAAITRRSALTA